MTGPGRPPTGERVQVRIPAEDLADIDRMAADIGATRATFLRAVIRYYLETHP